MHTICDTIIREYKCAFLPRHCTLQPASRCTRMRTKETQAHYLRRTMHPKQDVWWVGRHEQEKTNGRRTEGVMLPLTRRTMLCIQECEATRYERLFSSGNTCWNLSQKASSMLWLWLSSEVEQWLPHMQRTGLLPSIKKRPTPFQHYIKTLPSRKCWSPNPNPDIDGKTRTRSPTGGGRHGCYVHTQSLSQHKKWQDAKTSSQRRERETKQNLLTVDASALFWLTILVRGRFASLSRTLVPGAECAGVWHAWEWRSLIGWRHDSLANWPCLR